MKRNQLNLDVHQELIVDSFAGGGGASEGIELALARAVDIAINHDAEALAMHKANHPETLHLTQDVWRVDPREVTNGRPVGLAWFSPDCKDFSKAKGGKPVSKKIRGLAWVMVKWARLVGPRVMFLENVEEFQEWGPLLADNTRCPKRKGKTFRSFLAQLRMLGYEVDWRELRCCDYGDPALGVGAAPTIRKRLFLIARRDGRPIVWPKQTHGKPGSPDVVSGKLLPWRTAAECIDFSKPCPSIFLTKKQAKLYGVKRPLADATMRRIARGIFKFVINNPTPFIVKVNHTGYDQFRGQSIDEPLQTITAKHPYAVVTPHVTKFRTGATGHEVTEPMHTITAGPKKNPAGAAHAMGLVAAHITKYHGEKRGNEVRATDLNDPLHTQSTENRFGMVEASLAPFITEHANASSQRNMPEDEPLRTQCGCEVKGGHFAHVQAFLAKHYGGHETPGSALDKPADTVTAKDHHSLIAINLATNTSGHSGSAADKPAKTIATGNHHAVVASHLEKLYSSARRGASNEAPMPTVTSGGNHIAEVRAFLVKYYGTGGQDQSLDEPMHTIRARACMGLVTVHGEDYIITDIGMRMLDPRELFLAQGFPPDYEIEHVIVDGVHKRLPKHAQVRMCGNSVCPPMSCALVSANVPELSLRRRKRAA